MMKDLWTLTKDLHTDDRNDADDLQTRNHNPGSDEHKAGTRLSRHCGGMKLKGIPYTIEWSILKRTNGAFNPRRNFCQLCCMEKYLIMFNPDDATLNLRSEFFAHCRHKDRHLLAKS